MCGINGLIANGNMSEKAIEGLSAMQSSIEHRGPDDAGFLFSYRDGSLKIGSEIIGEESNELTVVLTHRRLSILDLSSSGRQPIVSADKKFAITFNGEIYNYKEIRTELESLGYAFHTQTDTEVMLSAFREWGVKSFNRFIGMFAAGILDLNKQELTLVRDFYGIKPLYYAKTRQGTLFSSEIKALFASGLVSREINPVKLFDYLRIDRIDQGSSTMMASVLQVEPGCFITFSTRTNQIIKEEKYWDFPRSVISKRSHSDLVDEFRSIFLESVKLHLRSDVPVGSALSGGIDSSSIVCAMRQIEPEMPIHTFSYLADDEKINEELWVNKIVKATESISHSVRPNPREISGELDRIILAQDQPFGSTSIYAQYLVFKSARENGIKVMLDGQGADEHLAGYTSYIVAKLADQISKGQISRAALLFLNASRLPHVSASNLFVRLGRYFSPSALEGLLRKITGRSEIPNWYLGNVDTLKIGAEGNDFGSILKNELLYSMKNGLQSLLRYEDRNSMFHSIESRVPFLNPRISEFVFSLPDDYLISQKGTTKDILRRAMRGIVPNEILDRKDKIGFSTPEQTWFPLMANWFEQAFSDAPEDIWSILDKSTVMNEWNQVKARKKAPGYELWRWANLARWSTLNKLDFAGLKNTKLMN